MNISDLENLKNGLIEGTTSLEEAWSMIGKDASKKKAVWQTKEWKIERDKIIKDYCEQCKSEEGPFVLQHLSYYLSYENIRRKIHSEGLKEIIYKLKKEATMEASIMESINKLSVKQWTCSRCKSINIRERKTITPQFVCNKCNLEFDEPILRDCLPRNQSIEDFQAYEYKRIASDILSREYLNKVKKPALLQLIENRIKYLSFENTATFCKKCAYLWDKHGKKLCSSCGKDYHSIHYRTCFNCSPKSKDPKVLKWIALKKEANKIFDEMFKM